jgi:hypothetical protein
VAVKVTDAPAQIVVDDALMLTLTGRLLLTTIVILLLETMLAEAQFAVEVISTVTTSPFRSVVLMNVGLFVPAFAPFTFH